MGIGLLFFDPKTMFLNCCIANAFWWFCQGDVISIGKFILKKFSIYLEPSRAKYGEIKGMILQCSVFSVLLRCIFSRALALNKAIPQ
jgi:hypothetical protein